MDTPVDVRALDKNLEGFADALQQLARHALSVNASPEPHGRGACIYCQATMQLSLVVSFGDRLVADARLGK